MPVVLRMTEHAGYTDWVLLLSGRSDRNVRGIIDGIQLALKDCKLLGVDGIEDSMWSLLDYDDFIIHTFYHPVRSFYDLESMWNDAPRVELGLPDELMSDDDLVRLDAPDPMPSFRGDLAFGGFDDEFDDDDDDEPEPLRIVPDPDSDGIEDKSDSGSDLFEE